MQKFSTKPSVLIPFKVRTTIQNLYYITCIYSFDRIEHFGPKFTNWDHFLTERVRVGRSLVFTQEHAHTRMHSHTGGSGWRCMCLLVSSKPGELALRIS